MRPRASTRPPLVSGMGLMASRPWTFRGWNRDLPDRGVTPSGNAGPKLAKLCYTKLREVRVGPKEGREQQEKAWHLVRGSRVFLRRSARFAPRGQGAARARRADRCFAKDESAVHRLRRARQRWRSHHQCPEGNEAGTQAL